MALMRIAMVYWMATPQAAAEATGPVVAMVAALAAVAVVAVAVAVAVAATSPVSWLPSSWLAVIMLPSAVWVGRPAGVRWRGNAAPSSGPRRSVSPLGGSPETRAGR